MAMMFQRGMVTSMNGIIPGTDRAFYVYYYSTGVFQDEPFFSGFIAGRYADDYHGRTLDETLDKIEEIIKRIKMDEALASETVDMEVAVL
jgi:hypothetical protein